LVPPSAVGRITFSSILYGKQTVGGH
jgi:hypothetical protein